MDKIRCPNCRGAKQVAKLGGMMGDCNLCNATGSIKAEDKPVMAVAEPVVAVNDIIKQVSSVAAVRINKPETVEVAPVEVDVKVNPEKAIYKRKQA